MVMRGGKSRGGNERRTSKTWRCPWDTCGKGHGQETRVAKEAKYEATYSSSSPPCLLQQQLL